MTELGYSTTCCTVVTSQSLQLNLVTSPDTVLNTAGISLPSIVIDPETVLNVVDGYLMAEPDAVQTIVLL